MDQLDPAPVRGKWTEHDINGEPFRHSHAAKYQLTTWPNFGWKCEEGRRNIKSCVLDEIKDVNSSLNPR